MRQWMKKAMALGTSLCIFLTACSGGGGQTDEEKTAKIDTVAMGRYIEEELTLPEGAGIIESLARKPDGTLEVFYNTLKSVAHIGPWKAAVSADGGKSWTERQAPFLEKLEKTTLMGIAYGKDQMLIRYQEIPQVMLDAVLNNKPIENMETIEQPPYMDMVVDAEGNVIEEHLSPLSPDGAYPTQGKMMLADNGDLIAGNFFSILQYEGTTDQIKNTYVLDAGGKAPDFTVIGNTLYVGNENTFISYDLTTGEKIGETQMQAAKSSEEKEGNKAASFNLGGGANAKVLANGADGKSIVYCDSTGIYRKVDGGSIEEKIVEGELTSLNMPSFYVKSLVSLDNDNFAVLFSGDDSFSLMGYTYSKDTPTVPETELKVYSLGDNKTIRQAMGLFQRRNSGIRVNYTVLETDGTAASKSDQLRSLSTELLAGKGPDVLILDGMPIQSYIDKNILLDLSGSLGEETGNGTCFDNIMKAFQSEDGKLYAVPARFSVPMMMGSTELVSSITDFSSLIDAAVKEKEQNGAQYDGGILMDESPYGLMLQLFDVCSPAWFHEDGSIKREELSSFLEGLKKLADPELNAAVPQQPEYLEYVQNLSNGALPYRYNHVALVLGRASSPRAFSYSDAAITQKETGGKLELLHGQADKVYLPSSIVGVNQNSAQKELAVEFIKLLLSEEVQKNDFSDGFPVNMTAYDKNMENPYEEFDDGSWVVSTDDDGNQEILNVLWPSEETVAQLKEMLLTLDTPSVRDSVIFDTMVDEMGGYFEGTKTLEETMDAIMQKVDLYLSE